MSRNEIGREGLRRVLDEQSFSIIGVYRDQHDLDLTEAVNDPGIIPMVVVDGAAHEQVSAICHHIHTRWPACKIVILASDYQSEKVVDAFHAGIDGYIDKQTSCASLTEKLKLVALGEKMVPAQVIFDLAALCSVSGLADRNVSIDDANLSDREIGVLQGLIRGEPNKVISRRLAVTEATVKVHVKSILRKTGVMNRTQAAIWGMSRGLTNAAAPAASGRSDRGMNGTTVEQYRSGHLN